MVDQTTETELVMKLKESSQELQTLNQDNTLKLNGMLITDYIQTP